VTSLKRIRFGEYSLGDLAVGAHEEVLINLP